MDTDPAVGWLSEVLAYDASACTKNCEKCGPGWDHEVTSAIDVNSAGLTHDCHGNHPACNSSWHECDGVMTLSERNELVRMIRRSTAPVLTAVDAEQPNLSINYKRGTTQISGCDGAVIASIAWTPEQAEAFGEWGPSRSSH